MKWRVLLLTGLLVGCGSNTAPVISIAPEEPVVIDRDQDGIPDEDDPCPDKAEDIDGDMDEDGCPEERKLVTVTIHQIKLNERVYFETAKTRVLEQSIPLIDEIAEVLTDNPNIHIRIEGHTDTKGGESYNEKLSQGRASSIQKMLEERGIDAPRLDAVGFGERRPVETNRTEEGRAANRRVEIHITKR